MENLEKALFYKPTGTVQIANKFSLIERKLLNAIIWHSQKNRFKPEERVIPIRDVFELIGLKKSENYDVIKASLRMLTGTIIEWNIFHEDKTKEWGVCTFLASGGIERGKVKYILNPKIIEQINQPTLYAKIQLLVQSRVRKRHALVLYEFFLDSLGRAKTNSFKIIVPLEKLYDLLGVNEERTYKFFNRDVIKPSLQEIVKHTDIEVTYKTSRKGRKVADIIFFVEKKETFQLSLDMEIKGQDTGRFDDVGEVAEIEHQKDLLSLLVHHGIGKRKAEELVNVFDADRIRGNVEHIREQQKLGKDIKNPKAYLVRAIEDDYRPIKAPAELKAKKEREMAAKRKESDESSQKERKRLMQEWKRFCEAKVKERFSEQPKEWQAEKRRAFEGQLKEQASQGNRIVYNLFRKEKYESPIVQAMFYSGLRDELLNKPEETNLDYYMEYRNR